MSLVGRGFSPAAAAGNGGAEAPPYDPRPLRDTNG